MVRIAQRAYLLDPRYHDRIVFIVELAYSEISGFWDVRLNVDGEFYCFKEAFTDFLFKCVDYSAETMSKRLIERAQFAVQRQLSSPETSRPPFETAVLAIQKQLDEIKSKADVSKLKRLEPEFDGLSMMPPLLQPDYVNGTLENIFKPEDVVGDEPFYDHGYIYHRLRKESGRTFSVPCTGKNDCPACAAHNTPVPMTPVEAKVETFDPQKEPLKGVIMVDSEKLTTTIQEAQNALNAFATAMNKLADQMSKVLQPLFVAVVKAFNIFADVASKEFALSRGAEQNAYEEMWKPARNCPKCEARLPKELVEKIEAGTNDCPQCGWRKGRCKYCNNLLITDHWRGGQKCIGCERQFDDEGNDK